MPVHAFADESRRGCRYTVVAAIVMPRNLRHLRRDLRGLLMPGQRELHFKKEKEARQRRLAAAICRLPVEVHVYQRSCERSDEPARQACIQRLTQDLLDRGAHRLAIDSRSNRDVKDEATIHKVIDRHAHSVPLVYEHLSSTSEPLLWVADSAAWCFSAGGHWRQRIEAIVGAVTNLDCP